MTRHAVLMALLAALLVAIGAGCRTQSLPPARVATRVAAAVQEVSATATAVYTGLSAAEAEPTAIVPPAEAREAVRLAIEDLIKRRGLRAPDIRLLRVEAVEWSDTSLGCPQADMVYAQVITPGFRVTLWARGLEYEYHTDEGRFAVWCEK
jgi:hypothetical protein